MYSSTTRTDPIGRLLEGPILATLLGLSGPTIVVMAVQAGINALEAYYVGWLGAEALAGVSLVFPLVMLAQMMSAGAMGGGVASAVARALGARDRETANALVGHGVVVALILGGVFTVGALGGGPALYRAMGATGGTLDAALAYSDVVFAGIGAVWLFNILGGVVRGTGNMVLPALVVVGGAPLLLLLSPALIFGWGPLPALGVAGAGVAFVVYYVAGTLFLLGFLVSGRGLVRLHLGRWRLRLALFADILRVGGLASLNTIQSNLTVVFVTALVGPFGTAALAGYGLGARLEYIQIPLVFGFGTALVTMVGTNVGAGQLERAERIAFVGAACATVVTGGIGLGAAAVPTAWLGLFSSDADVLAAGATYLRIVGPSYAFFGVGLSLYFASQGAGRLLWPFLAGLVRLLIVVAGGWLVIHGAGGGLGGLFAVVAVSFAVFGTFVVVAIRRGAWRR